MTSAIDPTKPEDGVPASKADLRSNLAVARTELEHGGFAQGFTPTRYGPPASTRVEDHLAAIDDALGGLASPSFTGLADTPADYAAQAARFIKVKADESGLEFAPAPGGSGGLTGWVDVRTDFAALGDGASDDTAALQNALNSGASHVFLPAGRYRITSALQITPGTTLLGAGSGATIIDAGAVPANATQGVLYCHGTTATLPAISAGFSEGDGTVAFALSIEAAVSTGDLVAIRDSRSFSFNGSSSAGHRDGCFVPVLSRSGSTLLAAMPIPRSLPAPVLAGGLPSDLEAVRLDRRGCRMTGLSLIGSEVDRWFDPAQDNGTIGLDLRLLAGVRLDDVRVLGFGTYALMLDRCAQFMLLDCMAAGLSGGPAGPDYGLAFNGSGLGMVVGGFYAGSSVGVEIEGASNFGGPVAQLPSHDITLSGVRMGAPMTLTLTQPSGGSHSFDSHENTYRCTLTGCTTGRISIRGEDHLVQGCMIFYGDQDETNPAIGTWRLAPKPSFRLIGNTIVNHTNNRVINLDQSLIQAGNLGAIEITGNTIYQHRTGAEIIRATGSTPSNTCRLVVSGNTLITGNAQDFLNVASAGGSYQSALIANNVLPAGVALGTIADVAAWRAINMVDQHLQLDNLPTAVPGGTGRLWSDGGTLKIT